MSLLAAYVSGHGFGHATRVSEVLREVRAHAPDLRIAVVTSAPEALFRAAIPDLHLYRAVECDVGLVQEDALHIDEAATAAAVAAFDAGQGERVARETAWLREVGAAVVLGDVPPLAFAAAAEAGVPSVALANFSWDWIYRHYAARQPELGTAAERAAAAYRRAGLLLELPFAGDLSVFRRRERIPLIARRPAVSRAEARGRLGLPGGPLVLLSFGGLGLTLDGRVLETIREFHFLDVGDRPGGPNLTVLPGRRLAEAGLGYVELVAAADVVVSKPGYGIVSDAIGSGTRLVYTDRGDFPEYPILVREMRQYLACAHVSNEDLFAGRLARALEAVLAQPHPDPPDLGGAAMAAERLMGAIGAGRA